MTAHAPTALVPRLTKEQAAIIGAYTGISCGPFSDVHALAERLLDRPIFTHQFADPHVWELLKVAVKPQFADLCAIEAPEVAA